MLARLVSNGLEIDRTIILTSYVFGADNRNMCLLDCYNNILTKRSIR